MLLLQGLGLAASEVMAAALFGARENLYLALGLAQLLAISIASTAILAVFEGVRRARSRGRLADFVYRSVALLGVSSGFAALQLVPLYILIGDAPSIGPDLPNYGRFAISIAVAQAAFVAAITLRVFSLAPKLKIGALVFVASLLTQLAAAVIVMPATVRIVTSYFLGVPTAFDFLGPNSSSLLWLLGAPYGPVLVTALAKRTEGLPVGETR